CNLLIECRQEKIGFFRSSIDEKRHMTLMWVCIKSGEIIDVRRVGDYSHPGIFIFQMFRQCADSFEVVDSHIVNSSAFLFRSPSTSPPLSLSRGSGLCGISLLRS